MHLTLGLTHVYNEAIVHCLDGNLLGFELLTVEAQGQSLIALAVLHDGSVHLQQQGGLR